ncbi:DUF4142 domain-containing protein [Deminuibacter soli]|uniref:DUF4142 domain-containing protein n=1 Tax=Deminuibacter soli TaxID=2291815 RepID=A0A3E1NM72_9BACT|nr:DUF4142 domain-containing protein [Deminuibacter soli]RFM29025.1 DUF4142 domain-containing protein [Deminuibacter soli]
MNLQENDQRRDFLKKSATIIAGLSMSGALLSSFHANGRNIRQLTGGTAITEDKFRSEVMPRAQLSILASQLAVDKAMQKNAKEFAGFELEEAIAVVKVLNDTQTPVPPMSEEGKALIEQLKSSSGNDFDKLYMQAQLSNHEFLRDLAKTYLGDAKGKTSPGEKETQHLATLALFAFNEHVALCKRIYGEVS